MNQKLLEEYLQAAKDAAARSRTLYSGVIGFALAILVTFLVQVTELAKLDRERATLESEIVAPWTPLRIFYERTQGFLDSYAEEQSTPWSQLFFLLSWEFLTLNEELGPNKDNPTIVDSMKRISSVGNMLHDYNSHIRNIIYHHRAGTPFDLLPKEALHSINYVLNFREEDELFVRTMDDAVKASQIFLHRYQQREKTSGIPPKVREMLEFGVNSRGFSAATTALLLQDLRSIGAYQSSTARMGLLDHRIDSISGESIGEVKRRIGDLKRRSEDIKAKSSASIPIVQIQIPYSVFWVAAITVNFFFLFSLFRLYGEAANYLNSHARLSGSRHQELYEVICRKFSAWGTGIHVKVWSFVVLLSPTIISVFLFGYADMDRVWQLIFILAMAATNSVMVLQTMRRGSRLSTWIAGIDCAAGRAPNKTTQADA